MEPQAYEDEPDELYGAAPDAVYDDASTGGQAHAYLDPAGEYGGEEEGGYGAPVPSLKTAAGGETYTLPNGRYDAESLDTVDGAYDGEASYGADELNPVDIDIDALLDTYGEEAADRMDEYDMDPEDGWEPLLDPDAYDEPDDGLLEEMADELDAYGELVDGQQYVSSVDMSLDMDDTELYSRWLEDEEGQDYMEIAVVEQEMPDGLFGFTRPGQEKVVFVNKALYKVDKEKTKLHEMTHQEHPHWSEFMVRSRRTRGGGDIDPQHTMSYQANNPGRIGNGAGRARQYGANEYAGMS